MKARRPPPPLLAAGLPARAARTRSGPEAMCHHVPVIRSVAPGAPGAAYRRDGAAKYEVTELLRPFQATSNLIGTTFAKPFVTAGAVSMSAAELDARAAAYAVYITSDSLEPLGDYE